MAFDPKKIVAGGQQENFLKMLVYGPSGCGKTVFGSTAPKPLFINAESGMLSVKDKQIDSYPVETFADVTDVYLYLHTDPAAKKYETVVLDSITEIQKKSMDSILAAAGRAKATIGDWGDNIEQIRKVCRAFRDLKKNVIVIALDSYEKDEATGIFMHQPALQGKSLPQEVMGFFDVVGYMVTEERPIEGKKEKEIVRAVRVQPTNGIYCKDRSGKLPIFNKPNFTEMLNTVFPPKAKTA